MSPHSRLRHHAPLSRLKSRSRSAPTFRNCQYNCACAVFDRFANDENAFASECKARGLLPMKACTGANVPELLANAPDTSRSAICTSTAPSAVALDNPFDNRRRPCLIIPTSKHKLLPCDPLVVSRQQCYLLPVLHRAERKILSEIRETLQTH